MSDVKRFLAPVNDTCDMDSYQMVVLASDYAALEAQLAKLRAGGEQVAFTKPSVLKECNVRYSTSTAQQPSAVPAGWKLVPVEPTEEMLESDFISCHCGHDFSPALFDHVWHKMLAAAPSAQATVQGDADNYRWLRDQHNNVNSDIGVYDGANILATQEGELDLDAAIAAARKGEGA